jgi:hypothetical protein
VCVKPDHLIGQSGPIRDLTGPHRGSGMRPVSAHWGHDTAKGQTRLIDTSALVDVIDDQIRINPHQSNGRLDNYRQVGAQGLLGSIRIPCFHR